MSQAQPKEDKKTLTPAEQIRAAAEEALGGVDIPLDDDLIMGEGEEVTDPNDDETSEGDNESDESVEKNRSITPAEAIKVLKNIGADALSGKITTMEGKKDAEDSLWGILDACEDAGFLRRKADNENESEFNPDNKDGVTKDEADELVAAFRNTLKIVRKLKVAKSPVASPQPRQRKKPSARKMEVPETLTPDNAKARLEAAESKEEIEAIMAACRRSGFLKFVEKDGKKMHVYNEKSKVSAAEAQEVLDAFVAAIRRTPPKAKAKPAGGKEKGGSRPQHNGKPKSAPNPLEIEFNGKKITPAEALARFKGPTRNRYEEALQEAIAKIEDSVKTATVSIRSAKDATALQVILDPFIKKGIICGPREGAIKGTVYFVPADSLKGNKAIKKSIEEFAELATSKTNALNRKERSGKRMTPAELRGAIAVLPPQHIAGVRVRMIRLDQDIPTSNGVLKKGKTFGLDDQETPDFLKRAAKSLIEAHEANEAKKRRLAIKPFAGLKPLEGGKR